MIEKKKKRVKTDDPDNLLCYRQKLTLVAGTLT